MPGPELDKIENLQADHSTLATMLRSRRAVSTVAMSIGARTLWAVYLSILDALLQLLKTR